jgi:hypothetical protein
MESRDEEKEYKHNIWEMYRKEWATATPEKKLELNTRMLSWQQLMKRGLSASQAYVKVLQENSEYSEMEEPPDESPAIAYISRTRKVPLIVLCIILVVAIAYGVIVTRNINVLNGELLSLQGNLAATQEQLSSTKQALASTQSDLDSTKQTLSSMEEELASTRTAISSVKQTLLATQVELGVINTRLSSTQQQLDVAQETLGGLGITLFE